MPPEAFKDLVLAQLDALGGVTCRAMFGGHGLYHGRTFFGIIFKGRLYFKTDESTRGEYLRHGMKPFRPSPRQTLRTYYEVPAAVRADPELLARWARRAIACPARLSPTRRRGRKPRDFSG